MCKFCKLCKAILSSNCRGKEDGMLFGERFEAKILVDDRSVREYVDADGTAWVRVCARRHSCSPLSLRTP
jgi:hypothetical protein